MIFHSVDVDPARGKNGWEDAWRKRYVIGVMLLDLEDPSRVIRLCKVPLMAPEGPEEQIEGFRTNALFPCGMILEGRPDRAHLLQRERHGGALGHSQARRPDLALQRKNLKPKDGAAAFATAPSHLLRRIPEFFRNSRQSKERFRIQIQAIHAIALAAKIPGHSIVEHGQSVLEHCNIAQRRKKTVPGWRSGFASNSRTEPSLKYTYT